MDVLLERLGLGRRIIRLIARTASGALAAISAGHAGRASDELLVGHDLVDEAEVGASAAVSVRR